MKRTNVFGFALILSLVASTALAHGLPARPRFQAVTVGSATAASVGDIAASGTISAGNVTGVAITSFGDMAATGTLTAGSVIAEAVDTGTSTTCGGFSSTSACAAKWNRIGALTCISWNIAGTSNATTFTMTGLTFAAPNATYSSSTIARVQDNGTYTYGLVAFSSGTLTFFPTLNGGSWTASGAKLSTGSACYTT